MNVVPANCPYASSCNWVQRIMLLPVFVFLFSMNTLLTTHSPIVYILSAILVVLVFVAYVLLKTLACQLPPRLNKCAVLNLASVGILEVMGKEFRISALNTAASILLGYTNEELFGVPFRALLDESTRSFSYICNALEQHDTLFNKETQLVKRDGNRVWVAFSLRLIDKDLASHAGFSMNCSWPRGVVTVQNIQEMKDLELQLQHQLECTKAKSRHLDALLKHVPGLLIIVELWVKINRIHCNSKP